jgi:hypothetical protein
MGYPTDSWFLDEIESNPDNYSYIFEQCRYYGAPVLQRGLFRDDDVYAISSLDVSAYALGRLQGPALSSVDLPVAYPNYYPYYGGGVVAGVGGSAGSSGMPDAGAGPLEPTPDGAAAAGGAAMQGTGGTGFE